MAKKRFIIGISVVVLVVFVASIVVFKFLTPNNKDIELNEQTGIVGTRLNDVDLSSAEKVIADYGNDAESFDALQFRGNVKESLGEYAEAATYYDAASKISGITQDQKEQSLVKLYSVYVKLNEDTKAQEVKNALGDEAFLRLFAPVEDITLE